MSAKRLPTSKTVVTDFKVQVVDMNLRLKALYGAHAQSIGEEHALQQGDLTITDDTIFEAFEIHSLIVIETYGEVLIDIEQSGGVAYGIKCTGLFILYGEIARVAVRSAKPESKTRMAYIWS